MFAAAPPFALQFGSPRQMLTPAVNVTRPLGNASALATAIVPLGAARSNSAPSAVCIAVLGAPFGARIVIRPPPVDPPTVIALTDAAAPVTSGVMMVNNPPDPGCPNVAGGIW